MQSLSYLIFLFIFSLVRSKEPVDEQHCEGKNSLILIDKKKTFYFYFKSINLIQCYSIGALETSATYALGDLSKPLSWGLPIEKICREKLSKTNPHICDLKYGKYNV